MIYVLFAAILVTIGISIYETVINGFDFFNVGDWPDVIIILAVIVMNSIIGTVQEVKVIVMNSIIGTVQEVKAEISLEALKNLSSPESTVLRDGKRLKHLKIFLHQKVPF